MSRFQIFYSLLQTFLPETPHLSYNLRERTVLTIDR